MEQKTISEPKELIQKHIDDIVDKTLKLESPTEKAWREMEEQMKSPEGLEGIRITTKTEKKNKVDINELEKKQAFFNEYKKWGEDYLLAVPDTRDLPIHLDPDVEFKNENAFTVGLEFVDYLVANAFDGASSDLSEELKETLGQLSEIIFVNILDSGDRLSVVLKSGDKKMTLTFETKYPFNYKTVDLNF